MYGAMPVYDALLPQVTASGARSEEDVIFAQVIGTPDWALAVTSTVRRTGSMSLLFSRPPKPEGGNGGSVDADGGAVLVARLTANHANRGDSAPPA
jgi:hypothetical protein